MGNAEYMGKIKNKKTKPSMSVREFAKQ